MPISARADSIPLPKGWPNRVRSGVIHVISLAHIALTFARGVAANSINARIRLKAENNRLRQEIALLIEEGRIKDARMDRIPAQRRPHFPPIERMLRERPRRRPVSAFQTGERRLRSKRPNHILHVDLTAIPIVSGLWARWLPFALPQRFGAVDKHGSLSVVERCIRTLKDECTRRVSVSYRQTEIRKELALFVTWYNQHRPNTGLDRRTPDEVYYGLAPACLAPRYEPRRKWPRRSPCAAPRTKIRGRRGVQVGLHVQRLAGRKHLPIIELKRAA